ncbi:MAG TPA: M48 family metalloprotease [Denitromonas sp.]|uniref:M48 family metalloprotease n=1 Tax=Denitromonas sp. TaxID=2734609 RepID=UPI001DAB079E|nr:M48 family metallopeptidase [Rhodocyclaceae bacterium]MCP5222984.1 M48 family metallopeptidase [Zoogloeaceae bacterium]HPR06203.1 M48 family metalloprotease [Denitromonas sp.]HQU88584.1 M48 family metalloprotease [Denitromonas sp.]HQV14790.1 M48 family metalloprotease [Denitromonas sp.]
MIKRILAFGLSAVLSVQSVAAGLPDLGESSAADLSAAAERRIGEQIIREIRWREPSYLDDPQVESYLTDLGGRLVAATKSGGSYQFFALRDTTLNAFAMPGGYIGVHTGLILSARSESELASVLAHEISHVEQHHIARLVGKQSQSSMIMLASLLVAVLAARSSDQVAQAAVAGGTAAGIQNQLGYTREFEREADRIGLQTLDAAGFDTRDMAHFFERLQQETRLYENNAPAYLRTHPLTTERIADMGNRVEGARYRQVTSSNDFTLVQARLATLEGPAPDVFRRETRAWEKASQPTAAQRYAYVHAALRVNELDRAEAAWRDFPKAQQSAMIVALGAELAMARRDFATAIARLKPAITRYPQARYLGYQLADARIAAGDLNTAIAELRDATVTRPDDFHSWTRLAKAYQASGNVSESHRAQAEVYALQGAWSSAIGQLEIALREGKADFYTQSAMDARLRDFRARYDDERAWRGRDGR